ncbi:MAG: DUF975 family protein [Firmicutes bacterium]|nr:DUF975 family protein [Bacillota bacterium]
MDYYRVIMHPVSDFRRYGRNTLRGRWKNAAFVCILYLILGSFPQVLWDVLTDRIYLGAAEYTEEAVSGFYSFFIYSVFMLGMAAYFLNMSRGRQQNPLDVLNGFEYIAKAMGLAFMTLLFTLLWGILFIVPGIIAAVRYSQAFYILAEHPEYSVMRCINESKYLMHGNKWKYFFMILSFSGWIILSLIPLSVFEFYISDMEYSAWFNLAGTVLAVPLCWVNAYINASSADFYNVLIGKMD